jgi:hypothetical protein
MAADTLAVIATVTSMRAASVTGIGLLMADGAAAIGVDGVPHLTSPSAMADGRATMIMTTAIQGFTPTHRAMSVWALAAAAAAAPLGGGDNRII